MVYFVTVSWSFVSEKMGVGRIASSWLVSLLFLGISPDESQADLFHPGANLSRLVQGPHGGQTQIQAALLGLAREKVAGDTGAHLSVLVLARGQSDERGTVGTLVAQEKGEEALVTGQEKVQDFLCCFNVLLLAGCLFLERKKNCYHDIRGTPEGAKVDFRGHTSCACTHVTDINQQWKERKNEAQSKHLHTIKNVL